ncbi:hypothetical protein KP509_1Z073500 [Ceratopteris richardii]|nr:hypothetical protein KP509_1Z073500 [Ceratopteris richardii]
MTIDTSEKRVTRSQAREGPASVSTATKTCGDLCVPSSATPKRQSFSRSGRRVFAELACNDSPVVGLLPAGTPISCLKDKCSRDDQLRIRRALLADTPAPPTAQTPLGESLLRSQVQMLLQKVESDMRAHENDQVPSFSAAMSFPGSVTPVMLVAPTPLNTPASVTMPEMLIEHSARDTGDVQENDERDVSVDETDVLHPSPFSNIVDLSANCDGQDVDCEKISESEFTESGLTDVPQKAPEVPSSGEIFVGKRFLHFDEVTPFKSSDDDASSTTTSSLSEVEEKVNFTTGSSFTEVEQKVTSNVASSSEEGEKNTEMVMRQLDDDEVSEWSMNVNVGSPLAGCLSPTGIQNGHADMNRFRDERDVEHECEEDEGDDAAEDEDYADEYYADGDDDEGAYDEEVCDELCDMFKGMGFEVEKKNLPKGEGKHTRFLYNEDDEGETMEAVLVKGEEDLSCSDSIIRLRGIPAPLGRHMRFKDDEHLEE